jgi:23S rRNA 5-hydroxycytidine C2501 synthase
MQRTPLELLAPAGTAEIGMAAIEHGADAVYIGASRFNARAAAGNAMPDIERLVRHAHLFYARVYVVLNTILTDAEMPEALTLARQCYDSGVDGLIIQDVGLLEQDLPPIPLIASTQMHNASPEKVRFLEAVGFKRVILARELSLEEIRDIRAFTRVELETFVHGSLCVSYSGQCHMSQVALGRSGNRGVCAQPCRSRFTLQDGRGRVLAANKYLLSLKDLNLQEALADLIAAGVTSFKIEGRYKNSAYVKNITAFYRRAIDRFIADHPVFRAAASGAVTRTFRPDPQKTFNRGYTGYFLKDTPAKVGAIETRKSIGKPIGKVTFLDRDFFRMTREGGGIDCKHGDFSDIKDSTHQRACSKERTKDSTGNKNNNRTDSTDIEDHGETVRNGDGLCFFSKDRGLVGFRVNRAHADRIYPHRLPENLEIGTLLYRNHDQALARVLKQRSAERRIGLHMVFSQDPTTIRLSIKDEDGVQTGHSLAAAFELAKNPSKSQAQVRSQLLRTGNTCYRVDNLSVHPAQPGFLPLSLLNRLRRETLEAHTQNRLALRTPNPVQRTPNTEPYPEACLDYRANVLNVHARRFYARHGAEVCEPALEQMPASTDSSVLTGKRVMTCRYCIRRQLDACLREPSSGGSFKEPLTLFDRHHHYRLEFDCNACRMNIFFER